MQEVELSQERKHGKDDLLTEGEVDLFRSAVGELMWVACMSRPDVMAETVQLSGLRNPTVDHILRANKMIRRLKQKIMFMTYTKLSAETQILAYGDASRGNMTEGRTQGGRLIFATSSVRKDNRNGQTHARFRTFQPLFF